MVSFLAEVKFFSFWPKTVVYSHFCESEKIFGIKDTTGKSISRGAEWHKFQLRSTFQ